VITGDFVGSSAVSSPLSPPSGVEAKETEGRAARLSRAPEGEREGALARQENPNA
jgi:hypothetical protein